VHQGQVKGEDRDRSRRRAISSSTKEQDRDADRNGMAKAEQLLAHRLQPGGLYDPANMPLLHHVQQALRAHVHYQLDVQYMIKDGQVVIVDEFTGRLMPGRRWSDGLHQAVEAKEGVKIERENQTLATITFQNYFRKYKKLAGMTGTAVTKPRNSPRSTTSTSSPFPTNRDMVRIEEPGPRLPDRGRKVGGDRRRHHQDHRAGPPGPGRHRVDRKVRACLGRLKKRGIKHIVLNAKYHAQEAESARRRAAWAASPSPPTCRLRHRHPAAARRAQARQQPQRRRREKVVKGEEKYVDDDGVRQFFPRRQRSTRQAARTGTAFFRTSAQWRKEHKSRQLGGLMIIGTERHESRRIDNQLRGRAGRQGDRATHASSVARRRPDAHLRLGSHLRADAAPRHGRGRADRARHGVARHRAGAEAGRSAELRGPQAPARV
jgi:preprotein translocase subunit SecA